VVNKGEPTTKKTGVGSENADSDVQSDPAKDAETGSDWTDEGGATPQGPANAEDASKQ
jgi:hypothetical protein